MEEYTETIIEDTEEPEIIEFFEYSDESIEIYENVLNEVDPTVPEHVKAITKDDITKWDKKASIEDMEQYITENKDKLKGEQGPQGIQGEKGDTGEVGKDGVDGKTPVKGEDYFTEADKQEIVNLVLNELPSSEEVSY